MWLFKVVSVLLSCYWIDPNSFLAQFLSTMCSNLVETWRNDSLVFIPNTTSKFQVDPMVDQRNIIIGNKNPKIVWQF